MNQPFYSADRFAKAYRLWKAATIEGEREAARLAAMRIAVNGGVSFEKACADCEAVMAGTSSYDKWKEQDRKAAERKAKREAKQQAKWDAEQKAKEEADIKRREKARLKHGPEEQVFAVTEKEAMLYAICQPWKGNLSNIRAAIISLYPIPETVRGLSNEFMYWHKLVVARNDFDTEYWHTEETGVLARIISDRLYSIPATSFDDVIARAEWFKAECDSPFSIEQSRAEEFAERVRADIEALTATVQNGQARSPDLGQADAVQNGQGEPEPHVVKSGRRTTAEKRAAVLELLRSPDGAQLSDREIARRVGVSPQTANTWRHRVAA